MTAPPIQPRQPDPLDEAALMAKHGITRTVVHQFAVDGFRYASLADAVAQARRRSEGGGAA